MNSVQSDQSFIMRFMLLMAILFLGACGNNYQIDLNEEVFLPVKIAGASDEAVVNLQKRMTKHHMQVITIGQEFMISIPARILFHDQSPRIIWSSYGLLDEVSDFLHQFRKVEVHVTAYASKYKSHQREKALTLARAKNVANYLYTQGIDSRFIFMRGMGSEKPLMVPCGNGDKGAGARVEIVFREAIV